LGTNETSDSTPPYCAIGELENTDPFFSLMLPRLNEQEEIEWQNTIAFTLAKGESFVPQADHILQTEGISEPLILNRQNRFLDEPLAVFRFLRRVYASVGHGRICIPALFSDPPPATHFPRFQIGAVELLPQGAFNVNDLGSLSNYYRPDGSSVYLRPGGGYYLRPA
jgi:hypothetical protein